MQFNLEINKEKFFTNYLDSLRDIVDLIVEKEKQSKEICKKYFELGGVQPGTQYYETVSREICNFDIEELSKEVDKGLDEATEGVDEFVKYFDITDVQLFINPVGFEIVGANLSFSGTDKLYNLNEEKKDEEDEFVSSYTPDYEKIKVNFYFQVTNNNKFRDIKSKGEIEFAPILKKIYDRTFEELNESLEKAEKEAEEEKNDILQSETVSTFITSDDIQVGDLSGSKGTIIEKRNLTYGLPYFNDETIKKLQDKYWGTENGYRYVIQHIHSDYKDSILTTKTIVPYFYCAYSVSGRNIGKYNQFVNEFNYDYTLESEDDYNKDISEGLDLEKLDELINDLGINNKDYYKCVTNDSYDFKAPAIRSLFFSTYIPRGDTSYYDGYDDDIIIAKTSNIRKISLEEMKQIFGKNIGEEIQDNYYDALNGEIYLVEGIRFSLSDYSYRSAFYDSIIKEYLGD